MLLYLIFVINEEYVFLIELVNDLIMKYGVEIE